MSEKLRLDKLLGHMGLGSRKEVRSLIKQGQVSINGIVVKKTGANSRCDQCSNHLLRPTRPV